MDFNKNFAYLVDLTQAKLMDMAEVLDMDRSYFSRWYNGKVIPIDKNWPIIKEKLIAYFESKLTEDMVEDFISLRPAIASEYQKSGLRVVLGSFLEDGYCVSNLQAQKEKRFDISEKSGTLAIGYEEILGSL